MGNRPLQACRTLFVVLVLGALTGAAYTGVSANGFISFDDDRYLTDNALVRRGISLPGVIWAFTTGHAGYWHPLTWISHMTDVQLFGMHAGAHHLMTLAMHMANVLLLYLLLQRLTGAFHPSFLVAALFAVHPLHVESVAWAAERKNVLSTLFALSTMIVYVRAARLGAVLKSFALPLLYALALMAKPMPVTLPFLLLLVDWWPLGRWFPVGRRGLRSVTPFRSQSATGWHLPPAGLLTEKFPLFVLAGASTVITFAGQAAVGTVVARNVLPFLPRCVNMMLSYTAYLAKGFWPTGLAVFYPYAESPPPWYLLTGSCLLLATISLIVLEGAHRRPWLLVGWLWYVGSLLPVIGIVQVGSQAMADRYAYLPLTGIFIALAWSLGDLSGRRFALCAAAVLALAAATSRQVTLWRDNTTLFTHALAVTRPNAVAHYALGLGFFSLGRFQDALTHYREARRLEPQRALYVFGLGTALEAVGDLAGAETAYRQSIALDESSAIAHNNLGIVLDKRGQHADAIAAYREALRLDDSETKNKAHFNLAVALHARGNYVEAEQEYRRALESNPDDVEALNNLGNILLERGRTDEAVIILRRAIRSAPGLATAHFNLGNALTRAGDYDGAAEQFRAVLATAPDDTEARAALDRVISQQQRSW